jgi:hypothetical protein
MLLDIAFGLFLGKYFSVTYFNNEVFIIYLGVFFALLPDIDFITNYSYNKTKKSFLKKFVHRGVIHTPIFYISLALLFLVLSYIFNFSPTLIWMFLIGTMYHLFHDLIVIGRGIMIFYPFSKYRLKIFPDNGRDGYLKTKILWWNEDSTPKYTNVETQSLDNHNWIKTWYFRPNIFLFSETLFALIFVLAFLYL